MQAEAPAPARQVPNVVAMVCEAGGAFVWHVWRHAAFVCPQAIRQLTYVTHPASFTHALPCEQHDAWVAATHDGGMLGIFDGRLCVTLHPQVPTLHPAATSQHSSAFWHAPPATLHATGASHVPPVQVCEQQSVVVLHAAPPPRHAEHAPLKHVRCGDALAQHVVPTHASPAAAHGSHLPTTQRLLQQSFPLLHASFPALHATTGPPSALHAEPTQPLEDPPDEPPASPPGTTVPGPHALVTSATVRPQSVQLVQVKARPCAKR